MNNKTSYNAKSDLKRISYILSSAVIMLCIFAAFAAVVLLPIYLLSKYQPNVYSAVVLGLIGLAILFFIGMRIRSLYKRYGSLKPLLIHLLVRFVFPIAIVIALLIIEGVLFRLTFGLIVSRIIASIIVVAVNVVIVWLLFLSRRIFFYTNRYLNDAAESSHSHTEETVNE